MKYFDWDSDKNKYLKLQRGVSFEDALLAIESGSVLEITEHPNKSRYPNQNIFVLEMNNYAYLVPYVEDTEKYFLKTIIPSRKMTRKYLKVKGGE